MRLLKTSIGRRRNIPCTIAASHISYITIENKEEFYSVTVYMDNGHAISVFDGSYEKASIVYNDLTSMLNNTSDVHDVVDIETIKEFI